MNYITAWILVTNWRCMQLCHHWLFVFNADTSISSQSEAVKQTSGQTSDHGQSGPRRSHSSVTLLKLCSKCHNSDTFELHYCGYSNTQLIDKEYLFQKNCTWTWSRRHLFWCTTIWKHNNKIKGHSLTMKQRDRDYVTYYDWVLLATSTQ